MIILDAIAIYITIKFQRALYCKIVESDTHMNAVNLGISMGFGKC